MMYSDLAKFMRGFSIFSEGEGGSKASYVWRGCWRGVKLSFAKSNLPLKDPCMTLISQGYFGVLNFGGLLFDEQSNNDIIFYMDPFFNYSSIFFFRT